MFEADIHQVHAEGEPVRKRDIYVANSRIQIVVTELYEEIVEHDRSN